MADGKLIHMTGPATEKALSPNFVLVYGMEQLVPVAEWNRYHAESLFAGLLRIGQVI